MGGIVDIDISGKAVQTQKSGGKINRGATNPGAYNVRKYLCCQMRRLALLDKHYSTAALPAYELGQMNRLLSPVLMISMRRNIKQFQAASIFELLSTSPAARATIDPAKELKQASQILAAAT